MKTPPLYFVRAIFAVELSTRKGKLISKDFIVSGEKVERKRRTLEKPNSLPNKLADHEHRNCVYKLENAAWFGQQQELLMPEY